MLLGQPPLSPLCSSVHFAPPDHNARIPQNGVSMSSKHAFKASLPYAKSNIHSERAITTEITLIMNITNTKDNCFGAPAETKGPGLDKGVWEAPQAQDWLCLPDTGEKACGLGVGVSSSSKVLQHKAVLVSGSLVK